MEKRGSLLDWGLVTNVKNLLLSKPIAESGRIESSQGKIVHKKYRPGDIVPESGIYRVMHESHRLMHEATLLEGQRFPICKQCKYSVRFELRRAVKNPTQITSGYHAILEDYPGTEPFLIN
jgi:hypothetical protein